jgi:hypothetical protein
VTWDGKLWRPLPTAGHDPVAVPPAAAERWLSWAVLALTPLALAIRVPLIVNAPLFHDETEHLHAVWAVAHGQVPYRDFFQNHPPLFYYLIAPLFALMGEDLRIIYVARGLMLLCILYILFQIYRIARTCFDRLTGLLTVLILSYMLLWWRQAYDFRPDIPQTLVVLMGLWRFMRAWERRSRLDFLAAGALLGIAFWLLIKTLFPLAGLTLVFALSAGLRRSAAALRETLTGLLLFLGAFAAVVGLGGVLLWLAGAWPGFLQWTIVSSFRWPERFSPFVLVDQRPHFVSWTLAIVGVGQTVTRMVRARVVDEVRLSPLLAGVVTAGVYLFLMPAPYRQSVIPFLPLAAMYGASVVRRVVARAVPPGAPARGEAAVAVVQSPARLAWAALAALLLFGVCVPPLRAVLRKMPPLSDQWADRRQIIRYVLALTSPNDSVFDSYGLYIFRPHATYHYMLVTGQLAWLRTGLMREMDIINDLRRSHCKVVIFSRFLVELPPTLLGFLRSHYVSTGFHEQDRVVLVAGNVLYPSDLEGNRGTVSLIASAEYAVRVQGGTPKVHIDGRLYRAPLFLEQGDHHIVVEGEFGSLAIFYSRASAIQFR